MQRDLNLQRDPPTLSGNIRRSKRTLCPTRGCASGPVFTPRRLYRAARTSTVAAALGSVFLLLTVICFCRPEMALVRSLRWRTVENWQLGLDGTPAEEALDPPEGSINTPELLEPLLGTALPNPISGSAEDSTPGGTPTRSSLQVPTGSAPDATPSPPGGGEQYMPTQGLSSTTMSTSEPALHPESSVDLFLGGSEPTPSYRVLAGSVDGDSNSTPNGSLLVGSHATSLSEAQTYSHAAVSETAAPSPSSSNMHPIGSSGHASHGLAPAAAAAIGAVLSLLVVAALICGILYRRRRRSRTAYAPPRGVSMSESTITMLSSSTVPHFITADEAGVKERAISGKRSPFAHSQDTDEEDPFGDVETSLLRGSSHRTASTISL